MPVSFNGNKIIPAPFANITKNVERRGDGKRKVPVFEITLTGKLVAYKGSPNSLGVCHTGAGYPADETIAGDARLASMRNKQSALQNLFTDNEGKFLEIQPIDGSTPIKFIPRLKSIQFPEGNWYDTCDYTINMEADRIFYGSEPTGQFDEDDCDESWQIEATDDTRRAYRVSHTLSAKRFGEYDGNGTVLAGDKGWEKAKAAVEAKKGLDTTIKDATGILNLSSKTAYNLTRAVTVDESNGVYAVTETWICYDPSDVFDYGSGIPAIEDFTVTLNASPVNSNLKSITVSGTITGLDSPSDDMSVSEGSTKWTNANNKFDVLEPLLLSRAESFSTLSLNPDPISAEVGRNPISGVITYNYTFDNGAAPTVTGALSSIFTITNSRAGDVHAVIPIFGRTNGPILENMLTKSESSATVSCEVVMPIATYTETAGEPPYTEIINKINSLFPSSSKKYVQRDEDNWTPETGRYSRTVTMGYQ